MNLATTPLSPASWLAGLTETLANSWPEVLGEAQALAGSELDWETWARRNFGDMLTAPFAEHHRRLWEWGESLERGKRVPSFVECWPRGGGKSSTAEMVVCRAVVRASRSFVLYVCATQDAADRHVQDIQAPLEALGIGRQESVYGASKGWRQNYLRTSNGVTIMGVGLDKNIRGLKVGGRRPDLIIGDDLDDADDGPGVVKSKIERLTKNILGTRAPECSVIFIQNLIHAGSIMSRVKTGRLGILSDRQPYQEVVAVEGLVTEKQTLADGRTRDVIVAGRPTWEGLPLAACQSKIDDETLEVFLAESQHVMRQGGSVFFPEFVKTRDSRPWHCVAPFAIPKHWPGQGGLDYGTRAPFAFVLDRFDPHGGRVTTHEIYKAGLDSAQQARLVLDLLIAEGLPLDTPIFADSAMFPAAHEPKVGTYPCDAYIALGLNLIPSRKGRRAGWGRMRQNMNRTVLDALASDPQKAPSVPGWRIVESRCPNLVEQLLDAVSSKKDPDDIDEGCQDHALDASQYNHRGGDDEAGPSEEERARLKRERELIPDWARDERRADFV